tara:strand:+ start:1341 stop:2120 length:780 start_codon:yes stop_codon:yes gene_type:complete
MVSELGLGAMDTPTSDRGSDALQSAIDSGITFIDTAREYAGSEMLIGQVLREMQIPPNLCLASKTFSRTANGSQYDIDRSLKTLGCDCISLYQLHDVSTLEAWEAVMNAGGALEGLQAARERGVIENIGISSHTAEVLRMAITCGEFDTVMLEYSAFYPVTAPLIDLAAEHDVGVIVMRPVGGSGRASAMRGRIAEGYDGPLTPANLLRYVWSNSAVSVAIPGARYPSRINENVATARERRPMDSTERLTLEAEASRLY